MPVADFGAPDVPCPLQLPLHPSFAKLTNPTPNLLAAAFRPGKLGRHATTEFENSSSDVRDRVWYTRTSGSYQSHAASKGLLFPASSFTRAKTSHPLHSFCISGHYRTYPQQFKHQRRSLSVLLSTDTRAFLETKHATTKIHRQTHERFWTSERLLRTAEILVYGH